MSQRTATIESLPMAFEVVKAMRADGLEWGESYRPLGRQALAEIIQGRMAEAVDDWLDSLDGSAMRDRRNGSYSRHLLTELGDIELSVPRTRRFCPSEVLRSYARRAPEIDRAILAGFVLGLSTRKVGEVLLALLGRKVSASTVSRVAKTLDEAVAAFHARPLAERYKALMLDGVVLARRTGAGALKRPVLVALGIRADGKKEIIDFHLATGESAAAWERFLTDLYRRGLTGNGLEMICADGGRGLIAALPTVYPGIPLQRCCQRRLKIRPKGGAKDCHLGWWSDLGVRLGVGDALRGFFGGSGQRSHAELKRSAPAGRPQGGMVYRVGVSLATRALGARCRPGPGDGVPQFSYRHCFCGRGFG